MSKIRWTPKSEQDLDEIREFIAKNFSVELAISIVDELVLTLESMLTENPLCGALLESNPLFSKVIIKGNSFYYCENPKDKMLYIVYVQSRKVKYNDYRIENPLLSNPK